MGLHAVTAIADVTTQMMYRMGLYLVCAGVLCNVCIIIIIMRLPQPEPAVLTSSNLLHSSSGVFGLTSPTYSYYYHIHIRII
jgi:hypothetical protein